MSFRFRFAASATAVSLATLLGSQGAMAAGFFNNQFLNIIKNASTSVLHTQTVTSSTTTLSGQFSVGPSNQNLTTGGSALATATSVINASASNTTTVVQQ
jgi:hypothetical protein